MTSSDIQMTVQRAECLRVHFGTKVHPVLYIKMQCNGKVYRTLEVINGLEPAWNKTFILQEGNKTSLFARFRLKEQRKILGIRKRGRQVGHGEITIKNGELIPGTNIVDIWDSWHRLKTLVAKLHIKVEKLERKNLSGEKLQLVINGKIEERKKSGNKFEESIDTAKSEKGEEKNQEDKKNEMKHKTKVEKEKKVEKSLGIVKINEDGGKSEEDMKQETKAETKQEIMKDIFETIVTETDMKAKKNSTETGFETNETQFYQSKTEKQSNLENLPPEVIQHIAKYLDFKSVTVLALTSRYMNNVLNDSCLWKHIYHRDATKLLELCKIFDSMSWTSSRACITCFKLDYLSNLVTSKLSNLLDKPPSNWKKVYWSEKLHIYLMYIDKKEYIYLRSKPPASIASIAHQLRVFYTSVPV
jgi:hypothetical protein